MCYLASLFRARHCWKSLLYIVTAFCHFWLSVMFRPKFSFTVGHRPNLTGRIHKMQSGLSPFKYVVTCHSACCVQILKMTEQDPRLKQGLLLPHGGNQDLSGPYFSQTTYNWTIYCSFSIHLEVGVGAATSSLPQSRISLNVLASECRWMLVCWWGWNKALGADG